MASKIKIEKGVPVTGDGKYRIYPFNKMQVGDSFLDEWGLKKTLVNATQAYGRRHSTKYIVRKTVEGVRVWRVK